MSQKIRHEIIETLLNSKRVLLAGHANPDGDSLGSILGLTGMLEEQKIPFVIVNEGTVPDKYRFLPGIGMVQGTDRIDKIEKGFDAAVVIECSNLERIGAVRTLIDGNCTIVNIDHHQDNVPFGRINLKTPEASAAGEMIYDILVQGEFAISRDMATNLYTAILTDTGRFHYNNTSPRCLRVAADLVEFGADPVNITEQVYYQQSRARLRLTGMALRSMEYLVDGRLCIMTVDRRMMADSEAQNGDAEGLVNQSLATIGVEVGVLFTEVKDDFTKVSLRSQDRVDVAEIAAHYGGGGHYNASGFALNLPLAETKIQVIKYIEDGLNGAV